MNAIYYLKVPQSKFRSPKNSGAATGERFSVCQIWSRVANKTAVKTLRCLKSTYCI